MKAWLYKWSSPRTGQMALRPTDADALDALKSLADGECVEVKIVRPRSVPWHRMYFGICKTIGANQDPERDADSIDIELRILSGHYDVMRVGPHEVRVPKRIAFDRLTADEWATYWKKVEVAIAERFGSEYLAEVSLGSAVTGS